MCKKIFDIQKLKEGNGATLMGLALILLLFSLSLMLLNYFNFAYAGIATQTTTDAITDGMAIAVNDGSGLPNVGDMEFVKDQLIEKNNAVSATKITDIHYNSNDLLDDRTNRILKVTSKAQTPAVIIPFFVSPSERSSMDFTIYTKGKNTTRVMRSQATLRTIRYPNDPNRATDPELSVADASELTASQYRNIVDQFDVELTERYNPGTDGTKEGIYLWDVTRALGCELPYFFKKSDGSPWELDSDNRLVDESSSPYQKGSVRDPIVHGYLGFSKKYLAEVGDAYSIPLTDRCLNAQLGPYKNWKVVAKNRTDQVTCKAIQDKANEAKPTVLLFTNGDIWIVLPEFQEGDGSRGLYVSYATSVRDSTVASNVDANSLSAGYRQLTGNYVAITYDPS